METITDPVDGIYSSSEIGITSGRMRQHQLDGWLELFGPTPVDITWVRIYKAETWNGIVFHAATAMMIDDKISIHEHMEFIDKIGGLDRRERVDAFMGLLAARAKREGRMP